MVGDRVSVVGAGMVGCCVARLLAAIPGVEVTLVDVDPTRAEVAAALDVAFAHPSEAKGGRDLVVHASATEAGLQRSLELLAPDGEVVDLSWYGDTPVRLDLGGAFHSGRLRVRASQVGEVALVPAAPADPRRAARAGPRPAPRPGLRRAVHRRLGVRGAARADGRPERRPAGRPLPHDHLSRPDAHRRPDVRRDRPRPRDDRPQLRGRGLRAGPAAARRDVRRGRDLPRPRPRPGRDPRRHRPRGRGAARACWPR